MKGANGRKLVTAHDQRTTTAAVAANTPLFYSYALLVAVSYCAYIGGMHGT